jgi:hypothetical protein
MRGNSQRLLALSYSEINVLSPYQVYNSATNSHVRDYEMVQYYYLFE